MPDPGRVGLIGFGLLGAAFAPRLQAAGFVVEVHEVDPGRRAEAARLGFAVAASLGDLATSCNRVVAAVYSGAQVGDVLGQLAASQAAASRGLAVICCTTLDPDSAVRLAARAEAAGVAFLEFPVSGTSAQILQGLGLGLCAGSDELAAAHRGVLAALTPRFVRLGEFGMAARAKLAINLVLEINRSALAEGMLFAERLGLDLDAFEAALRDSAAYSRVMDGKAAKLRTGDFTPEGRLSQSLKDVRMMLTEAARRGLRLPMTEVQAGLLGACEAAGEGELDGTAVVRELRRRAS